MTLDGEQENFSMVKSTRSTSYPMVTFCIFIIPCLSWCQSAPEGLGNTDSAPHSMTYGKSNAHSKSLVTSQVAHIFKVTFG